MIRISVNGENLELNEPQTPESVLRGLGLDPEKMLVIVNSAAVGKDEMGSLELKDGDVLDILQFAGGG